MLYREEALELGLAWPTGLLLHGPPGCGKSLLVSVVAAECGARVHAVLASQLYGAYLGEPYSHAASWTLQLMRIVLHGKAVALLDKHRGT